MKLTHVFGLVAAVHAAVFTVIFATPGCRSTGKQKPRPEQTDPAVAGVTPTAVDNFAGAPVESMSYDDINAGVPASDYTSISPVAPVTPATATYDAGGAIRYAPTRPTSGTAGALAPTAPPAPVSSIHTVVKGDNLWTLSRKYGVTVGELAAANSLSSSATLRIGQTLTVPATAVDTAPSGQTSEAANTYTVVSGDTLGGIARKQGTTVSALRAANNLSGDMLRVGQKLVLPGDAIPLSPSAAATTTSSSTRAGSATYTVVPGDTLGAIAQRSGVKLGDLALLNNITDPAKLRVGQVLKLPAGATTPAARSTSTASRSSSTASSAPAPVAPAATPPVEPVEATGVTPVEPVLPVEPIAIPVIRIDD